MMRRMMTSDKYSDITGLARQLTAQWMTAKLPAAQPWLRHSRLRQHGRLMSGKSPTQ
jgi:hypothetical protein